MPNKRNLIADRSHILSAHVPNSQSSIHQSAVNEPHANTHSFIAHQIITHVHERQTCVNLFIYLFYHNDGLLDSIFYYIITECVVITLQLLLCTVDVRHTFHLSER